jgi:dTDP-4-dehydrorhamnose reductase
VRVAVVGAGGQVGAALVRALAGHAVLPWTRADFDLEDPRRGCDLIQTSRPHVVILCSALVDVQRAERDPDLAFRVNAIAPGILARAAREIAARFVYVSTDYVFDGASGAPYDEWSATGPLSVYGRSKRAGEVETLSASPDSLVVRTSSVFGGPGRNFVNAIRQVALSGRSPRVVADEVSSPTYADDLASAIGALLGATLGGVFHLTNEGECSRYELARAAIEISGIAASVEPITTAQFRRENPDSAPRPRHSTLANLRARAVGVTLPHWRDALTRHLCTPAS